MIGFSPPKIYQEIKDEILDCLDSGWITTGPKTKAFEEELAQYTGVEKVLAVNAATNGMELIMKWFGLEEGDEVIVPVYTYCATGNVVLHNGAKVVLVDVGSDFNISVDKVREKINNKTKVIMPVDLGGWPCDYDQLNDLVNESGIKDLFDPANDVQNNLGRILLLADAAHSLGARYNGKMSGSLADVTVFSFHAVKNLTTSEGGAVCFNLPTPFNNSNIYDQLRVLSLHGQSKDAFSKLKGGNWQYDIKDAGYKYNMPDILAAMGLVEMRHYEKETLARRKKIFSIYSDHLKSFEWSIIPTYKDDTKESSYHVFPLRINGIREDQRNRIIDIAKENGVALNVHFLPLAMLSLYKEIGYDIKDFPVAYDQFKNEISLPVFYDLTDQQAEIVIETLAKAVDAVL